MDTPRLVIVAQPSNVSDIIRLCQELFDSSKDKLIIEPDAAQARKYISRKIPTSFLIDGDGDDDGQVSEKQTLAYIARHTVGTRIVYLLDPSHTQNVCNEGMLLFLPYDHPVDIYLGYLAEQITEEDVLQGSLTLT